MTFNLKAYLKKIKAIAKKQVAKKKRSKEKLKKKYK